MLKTRGNKDFAAIATAFIAFIPMLSYYINYIIQTTFPDASITEIVYVLLYLLIGASYLYAWRKNKVVLTLLYIIALVYNVTRLFWPQNVIFMFGARFDAVYNPLYRILFLGFPLVFLPPLIKDSKAAFYWMNKMSRVIILVALYAYFFLVIGKGRYFEYMTFSYNLLLPLCISFLYAVKKRQISWQVINAIGFICVIAIGSRGAMISAVMFFAIYLLYAVRTKLTVGKLILMMVLICGIIYAIVNIDALAEDLYNIFNSMGFESRSLKRFLDGTLTEDTARTTITKAMKQAIADSPFVGHGIFGDRYINTTTVGITTYAHNIILEIMCQYGVFIGGAVLYLYFSNVIKTLFNKTADVELYYIFIAVFSSVFFKLFVTGSYLGDQMFYLLVGFILSLRKNKSDKKAGIEKGVAIGW